MKEQIAETYNRPGYKMTKLGWIPEEWKVKGLSSFGRFEKGKGIKKSEIKSNGYPCIRYGEIYVNHHFYIKAFNSFIDKNSAENSKEIIEGDILFAGSGETLEDIGKSVAFLNKFKAYAGGDIVIFRDHSENAKFLGFQFNSNIARRQTYKLGQGHSVVHIYSSGLSNLKIPLPPLPEQKKIADILSTWDKAIETTQALIDQLQLRKKGLMQQLLTGKKRLPGFSGEWEKKRLSEILITTGTKVEVKTDQLYSQIGVRSHTKGIFYKEAVYGKQLGDKRVFWIEPDCFIVNIVFAWEHAIAKTTAKETGMIASHRFPMYKPKLEILDLDYLLFYFKTPRGKYLLQLASPGGAGRNKTLGKSNFLELQIPVPSLEEQFDIAQVLINSDKEIDGAKEYLVQLQEQKKGLMQQLLTGAKRVKV